MLNKNIQTYIIRHMYEIEKFDKNNFTTILEYLQGLPKDNDKDEDNDKSSKMMTSVRQRIIVDARKRAIRYKQYEKEQSQDKQEEDGKSDDEKDNNNNNNNDKEEESSKTEKKKKKKSDPAATTSSSSSSSIDEEDLIRWNKLNDNDKRKEYKRARKVIDTL